MSITPMKATLTYVQTVELPPQVVYYPPIDIIHSERHCMEIIADKIAKIPILGLIAAIPRVVCSSAILLGTSIVKCISCCLTRDTPCEYTANRAHNECCRGCIECFPCGSQCLKGNNEGYEKNGYLSPLGYGRFIYRDPITNSVVYSKNNNHSVYGWKEIRRGDEEDPYCCPGDYAIIKKQPPQTLHRTQTTRSTQELSLEEFEKIRSTIELSIDSNPIITYKSRLSETSPEQIGEPAGLPCPQEQKMSLETEEPLHPTEKPPCLEG